MTEYPHSLRELKILADDARRQYHAYKRPKADLIDDKIAADLTDIRLRNAAAKANAAYETALENYLSGAGTIK